MNLLVTVKNFSSSRLSWLLLTAFVIFFAVCAFVFQHIMKLEPCVMCIYERVAMISIGVASVIGLIAPHSLLFRYLGLAGWLAASYKGLVLALEHVSYQNNIFATCEALSFPAWAPLNELLPSYFDATGNCSEIVWQFLTLSMPQWLVIIFAANLGFATLFTLVQVIRSK